MNASHVLLSPRAPDHTDAHDSLTGTLAHRHARDRLASSFPAHCRRARRPRYSAHTPHKLLRHLFWPTHSTTGPHARRGAHTNPLTHTTQNGLRGSATQFHACRAQPQSATSPRPASCPNSRPRRPQTPLALHERRHTSTGTTHQHNQHHTNDRATARPNFSHSHRSRTQHSTRKAHRTPSAAIRAHAPWPPPFSPPSSLPLAPPLAPPPPSPPPQSPPPPCR